MNEEQRNRVRALAHFSDALWKIKPATSLRGQNSVDLAKQKVLEAYAALSDEEQGYYFKLPKEEITEALPTIAKKAYDAFEGNKTIQTIIQDTWFYIL